MVQTSQCFSRIVRFTMTVIVSVCLAWPPSISAAAQEATPPPKGEESGETLPDSIDLQQATVEVPEQEETPQAWELVQATVEVPEPEETLQIPEPDPAITGENNGTNVVPADEPGDIEEQALPTAAETGPAPELLLGEEENTPEGEADETISAIVSNLAENELMLIDEEGETLPLASAEAAQLLTGADPYFTDNGITYGWTGAGSAENPLCSPAVTAGYCTFSENPINDAIASPVYAGQPLTIEEGDYGNDNLTIARAVNFNPLANLAVTSITLSDGAQVNWFAQDGQQYYLTSLNVFINPGAYLTDAMEVAAPGAVITLAAGSFDDDAGLDINKSVTITGAGRDETVIIPAASCNRCERYFLVNADNVKIHDLELDGQYRVNNGIAVDNSTNLEVYDTAFINIYRYGILVSDISAANGGDSDTIATATYNIHNNHFQNILAGGATNDGSAIKITDNSGAASDHVIADNRFTQTNRAVWVKDSSVNITGNDFFANKFGVFVEDLDPGMELSALRNRFVGNTSKGINYSPSASNDPVINALDNWWGCSGGPGTSGCDSMSSTRAGKIDAGSFLKLGLSADPSQAGVGAAVNLIAYMYSSADGAQTHIPGLSWFNPPAITPVGTLIGSLDGNVFTPNVEGTQSFSVSFDNGNAAVQVIVDGIYCPPGSNDADGDGDCDPTICAPGFFDADSDGECEETVCGAGTFDADSDGECEPVVCDDNDQTTENVLNPDGSCSFPLIDCDDGDPKTDDILNPDGSCCNTLKVCDDGLPTTVDTLNDDGSCSFVTISCDDDDPKTDDILNPDGSCSNTLKVCDDGLPTTIDTLNDDGTCSFVTKTCDDNDPRTNDILNDDGTCSFILKSCDDGDPKTDDLLNPDGSCSNTLKVCDDGLPTTVDTLNDDGTCSFVPISCDDSDPKTDDLLNPDGSCSNTLKVCDDSLPTTIDTLNDDGTCSFVPISCDDGDPKTDDLLNPDGSCSHNLKVCDDGLPTTDDILNEDGTCTFLLKSCNDGDPKTTDILNPDGSCSNPLIVCDDGLPTTDDILNEDGTCSFLLKSCVDGDPRTEDILNPDGSCDNSLKVCDDGIPITENILNDDGTCSFPLKVCDDGLPTTEDILNEDGTCSFPVKICDDADPRTENILNPDGSCSFVEKSCDDGNPQTEDILNLDGSCINRLKVCDDGLATTDDILNPDGSCSFPLKTCDDGDARTNDILNADGSCSFVAIICDDGLPTTENILNPDGTCSYPLLDCDDSDPSTIDSLQNDGTCSHTPASAPGGSNSASPGDDEEYPGEAGYLLNLLQNNPVNGTGGGGSLPVTGGLSDLGGDQPVELSLPDGQRVVFSHPLDGFSGGLFEESQESLPAPLPKGLVFGKAMTIAVQNMDVFFPLLPEPVSFTLHFEIPQEFQGMNLALLFWDPEWNAGAGGWMEYPLSGDGNGDNFVENSQGNDRRIIQIESITGNELEITLNFTGVFVLAGYSNP